MITLLFDLKRGFVRKTVALLAACAIVAALTGCSSSSTVAGCTPTVGAGSASKILSATGAFDSAPNVTIPTPLYAATTQASTLIAGHGAAITSGQPVLIQVTIVNGRNSSVLLRTDYASAVGTLITAGKSSIPALTEALVCAQVGSRVAVITSPKDGHDGKPDVANGVKKNDSIIYVIDIERAFLAKATGVAQSPVINVPAVVTTANGTPGITLPTTPEPASLQTTILKSGSGAQVKVGSLAVLQYTAIGWTDAPTVFDSTWKTGQARILQVGSSELPPGLSTALVGKRVGSQVIVAIPAQLAAQADGKGAAPADATVVYVVDILGIAA